MRNLTSTLPITGTITALVTPFRNGRLDRIGLMSLVEWQILHGVGGLAACCLAGEAPTLTAQERAQIIGICVEIAEGQVPVIAGTGSNCTQKTIDQTAQAKACGASAALVAVPYYNRPTQQGIIRHFETVARNVDLPIIVYHAPVHQAVDLTPQTITRLAAIPSLTGIVDCTGDLARLSLYRPLPDHFLALSGDDETARAFNLAGGHGTLSSIANLMPRLTASLHHPGLGGNPQAASSLEDRLRPLLDALGGNQNPATLKYALGIILGCSPEVRLPMVQPEDHTKLAIRQALRDLGIDEHDRRVIAARHLAAGAG